MAKGPTYRVPFRRRKQAKTNYQKRKALIQSKQPLLTVRTTKKHLIAQIIQPKTNGDQTITSAHTQQLTKNYEWKAPTGNTPAAYLTGLLCGHKATTKGIKKAVLNIGLQTPSKGAKIFAALKGILDAGLTVPHNKEMLPDEKRIQGQHITNYAKKLSSDPETYQKRFAEYLAKGLRPEQLTEHFTTTKEKITSSFETEKKK